MLMTALNADYAPRLMNFYSESIRTRGLAWESQHTHHRSALFGVHQLFLHPQKTLSTYSIGGVNKLRGY